MAATGLATIGSHTHTHRVLAGASAADAADEIARSVGLIEERLGRPCRHFAYPKAIAPSPAAEVVVRRQLRDGRARRQRRQPSPARPTSTGSGATP